MTKRKYRNRAIRIHEDIFDVDSEKCKKINRMDQEMEEFNKALALKTTENVESNYSHLKSHHENNMLATNLFILFLIFIKNHC